MLTATFEYDQNVLTSDLLDILQSWKDTQDDILIARRAYDIGRTSFRQGIPLADFVRAVHEWKEESASAAIQPRGGEPGRFSEFITHFLTRGYEDAVR
jgi:hypothetical protein